MVNTFHVMNKRYERCSYVMKNYGIEEISTREAMSENEFLQ